MFCYFSFFSSLFPIYPWWNPNAPNSLTVEHLLSLSCHFRRDCGNDTSETLTQVTLRRNCNLVLFPAYNKIDSKLTMAAAVAASDEGRRGLLQVDGGSDSDVRRYDRGERFIIQCNQNDSQMVPLFMIQFQKCNLGTDFAV